MTGDLDLSSVTAAVLAGGLGTRLRSAVADRPKVLAEVRGRPFLTYIFDQLVNAGVQQVVLSTGYLGGMVCAMFGGSYDKLRIVYSQESLPMGTAGALRLALPLFESDTVLVMNGDSFCDISLSSFWDWHCHHEDCGSLVVVSVTDVRQSGSIELSSEGKVLSFKEKCSPRKLGWINAGVYLLPSSFIEMIPRDGPVSLEHAMFPFWIGKGLYGYQSEGKLLDIGTPESYGTAEQFFGPEEINRA